MNENYQSNNDLIDEACEWAAVVATSEGNELERRRFENWLKKSPVHAEAYREACAAFNHPLISAAIAQSAHEGSRIDPHATAKASPSIATLWKSRARIGTFMGALAASVLVVIWGISLIQSVPPRPATDQIVSAEHATTGVSIREVVLPDGSVATLGAQSAMTVSISANERRVTLTRGEAYFEVVSDATRPFIVRAGATSVQAIGTAFDVRLAEKSVRIDVIEGKIRVKSPSSGNEVVGDQNRFSNTISASAGERLIFVSNAGLTKRTTTSGTELAAWRVGRLEYYGEELGRIVADANRYYQGDIKIISDNISTMNVTASFPTSSIEHIFELLAQQVPISVNKTKHGDILISEREN